MLFHGHNPDKAAIHADIDRLGGFLHDQFAMGQGEVAIDALMDDGRQAGQLAMSLWARVDACHGHGVDARHRTLLETLNCACINNMGTFRADDDTERFGELAQLLAQIMTRLQHGPVGQG